MSRTQSQVTAGILAPANAEKRSEILDLLERAYWMEMETVMSYVANAAALDGIRAEEIAEALQADVDEELGHARAFAARIKDLYGTPPGSLAFSAEQTYLQPPEDATDVVSVIRGVIEAEAGAIAHYNRIIEATDGVDWATQDMVIEILRDEESHLRQFERYLREFE
jgi:bacterioferritin